MIDYLLFLPFFSTMMIVINVYNGDITGLDNNIEYIFWYIPIIISYLYNHGLIKTFRNHHVSFLGIILNLFWYFESPFLPDKKIRHRTEYYDTQCLLCGMIYHTIYEKFLRNTS